MTTSDEELSEEKKRQARAVGAREDAVSEREDQMLGREEELRLREELVLAREEAAEARAERERLLVDLRDANEKLILASIRFQELAEVAEDARHQLEVSEHELRDIAGFRERLMGIVGHDLRNPLSAIAIAVDMLFRSHQLDPTNEIIVQRIRRSTLRMGAMIGQLLDFTRAHVGGGIPLNRRPTDLQDLCRKIVDELEFGRAVPGRFDCDFAGDLTGEWDPDRLGQLISNLGGNALAHGTPDTPIRVCVRDEGGWVVLEMSNRGEPIPPDLLPVIFNPFRRGRELDKTGGLGLGLYISHQIVEAHGGSIAVRSTAAEGTTFAVRLPRRPASALAEVRI